MKYAVTCIAGVESLLKREIEKIGGTNIQAKDRLVECEGDEALLAKLNLWVRTGNKVYIVLAEGKGDTFDQIFDLTKAIDWKKIAQGDMPIVVHAVSSKSWITSIPAIQKTVKKAIVEEKTQGKNTIMIENETLPKMEVLAMILDNRCRILLNTSGEALHKRGYRRDTVEAPIKESLAASLVMLSAWRYKEPLYDIFCGSGTIPIEAALIARNRAPGLKRSFSFENFSWYPQEYLAQAKKEAEDAIIHDRTYTIIASDCDESAISIAKENAKHAGVGEDIHFSVKDSTEYQGMSLYGTIVSNPPYGLRLHDLDLERLYGDIARLFDLNPELSGGVITSYEGVSRLGKSPWKTRKLYNGNELCYFYGKVKK